MIDAPVSAATLLSVDQVAEILKLQVRTIRGYVRSGALRSIRIGKQYRIALSDLEAFVGRPVENHDDQRLSAGGRIEISSVISVEGVSEALASRLTTALMGCAQGARHTNQSLAVSTTYAVELNRLRILVSADLPALRGVLSLLDTVLEQPH